MSTFFPKPGAIGGTGATGPMGLQGPVGEKGDMPDLAPVYEYVDNETRKLLDDMPTPGTQIVPCCDLYIEVIYLWI